ncbi:MAG: cyclic nucleotide-binding/CBS domain-containing protein [Phycisphaerae bacterium]
MKTVEDILMSKGPDVMVATPDTTITEAVKMMVEAKCGCLVILDGHRPVGIFSERDLLTRVVAVGKDPATLPVKEVMTASLRSVGLQTPVRQCARLMQEHHIRHLAIIEEDALVGMISFRDVLAAELEEAETAG